MRFQFLFLLIFTISSAFAQIGTLTISPKVEERVIMPYDSLENITRSNLPSLVGQKIQIIPQQRTSSLGLDTGPTLYNSKPSTMFNNDKVVNPDTRFTIYNSKFGSFDNEVFDIVGVDSIFDSDFYTYRTGHFYLIVKNEKYPTNHYLDIALTNDEYDSNKKLIRRTEFYNTMEFMILGYYEKCRQRLIGTKLVNKYPENKSLGGNYIVYNVSSGEPLTSIPENLVWTIKDITLINSQSYKGLGYILSSDSMPDCFTSYYLNSFENYDEFVKSQQEKKEWEQKMIRTYGKTNGKLIIDGRVKIGFTKKMCEEAWGKPSEINKSIGSWGVHEQWVYGLGSYLYFENGKLTSIDN